jgi:hypothetical protein
MACVPKATFVLLGFRALLSQAKQGAILPDNSVRLSRSGSSSGNDEVRHGG